MTFRAATTAILFAASALIVPASLQAQITTFVAPARKAVTDSAKAAVVAANATHSDSVARMSLTNMKAWVDSAAGVPTPTEVASADTTAPVQPPATTANPANATSTTTFSNGAIAPNTASPLPFYFATGLITIAAGLVALRLARRRA